MTAISTVSNETVDEKIAKMIPAELKNDRAYLNLVRSIHSVAYMKGASGTLKKYMRYREIASCEKLVKEKRRIIEDRLGDFFAEGCKDIQNSTVRLHFAHLKLFYSQNDVKLNWEKLSKRIGKKEKNKNRAYHLDEITQLLQYADHRGKVVILLLASTGMRIGALPTLNVGDLKAVKSGAQKMYMITVYRGDRDEYVTFCTPECTKAIDNYIDFRKRSIREPVGQASPLIRNAIDVKTAESIPDKRLAERMRDGGLRNILEKIWEGSGVKSRLTKSSESKKRARYEAHLSRAFRKFFFKAMVNAKVEPIHRHALVGHKDGTSNIEASNLAMIYGAPEESELFASYVTAIEYLTIDQSETLAKKNEELKERLDEANVSRKEFDDLKEELFRQLDRRGRKEERVKLPAKYATEYIINRAEKLTLDEQEIMDKEYGEYLKREEGKPRYGLT